MAEIQFDCTKDGVDRSKAFDAIEQRKRSLRGRNLQFTLYTESIPGGGSRMVIETTGKTLSEAAKEAKAKAKAKADKEAAEKAERENARKKEAEKESAKHQPAPKVAKKTS